jgi:hypothetical protein
MSTLKLRWATKNADLQEEAASSLENGELSFRNRLCAMLDPETVWLGKNGDPGYSWLQLADGRVYKVTLDAYDDPVLILHSVSTNNSRAAIQTNICLSLPDGLEDIEISSEVLDTVEMLTTDFKVLFQKKYPQGCYALFFPPFGKCRELKEPQLVRVFGECNQSWVAVMLSESCD